MADAVSRIDASLACEELKRTFGANVRARRLKLGLTQAQLNERLGRANDNYVCLVEAGKKSPWLPNVALFAAALECPAASLFRPRSLPTKAE